MIQLSDEQLNNLGKEALIVIVSSLQVQPLAASPSWIMPTLSCPIITARSNFSQNRSAS